jgi:hypothetical protein
MTSSPRSSAASSASDRSARRVALGTALLLVLARPVTAQQPPLTSTEAITAAEEAATSWLALLAADGYVAAWETASPPFQKRVRLEDWTVAAPSFRDQFVRADRRRLVESYYRLLEPPHPEPGEYVTLRYTTVLSPERQVSETLLLIRDPEGRFRVSDWVLWPNVNGDPILDVGPAVPVRPPPRPTGPPVPPPMVNQAAPRR